MVEAIDTHTHFVPRHIPAEPGRNPLWPSIELKDTSAAVMVGGKVFRIIDSRSWDARRRLDDMAVDDVDVQVISPMPELLSHWFPADDADALCRCVNEGIAALCADHPGISSGSGWCRCRMLRLRCGASTASSHLACAVSRSERISMVWRSATRA
ncbi:amidohydrolase family protein [Bradyrhizobium sp. 197]|nr:amidohydrolase family protein [Bradyrhizobium sp. 197]